MYKSWCIEKHPCLSHPFCINEVLVGRRRAISTRGHSSTRGRSLLEIGKKKTTRSLPPNTPEALPKKMVLRWGELHRWWRCQPWQVTGEPALIYAKVGNEQQLLYFKGICKQNCGYFETYLTLLGLIGVIKFLYKSVTYINFRDLLYCSSDDAAVQSNNLLS